MIQRIQSVYLFTAFLLLSVIALAMFPGSDYVEPMLIPSVLSAVIAVGALIAIFLYGNRTLQGKVTGLLRGASIALPFLVVAFGVLVSGQPFVDGLRSLASLSLFGGLILAAVALHYARKGIERDIELIRSMDRLR